MSWQQSTIDEACLLVTDGTHYTPPDVGQGIPFLTVKDCSNDGHIDLVGCSHITEDEFAKAERGNSAPKRGDVLFSKDGTVGKVYVVDTRETFAVLSSLAILRPDASRLDASYFGWVLKTDSCLDQASQSKTGSAIRRIILKDLKRVRFPLPPLPEQKRIAGILDAADALRAKRRETLAQLDTLLQSTFLDMFGELTGNGWEMATVEDVARNKNGAIRTGPFGSQLLHSEFVGEGIRVLGIDNAVANVFREGEPRFITPQKYERLRRFTVRPGDVLITIMGTCGRCAVVPEDVGVAINTKHLCCITLDREKCLPGFMHAYFLEHPLARRYLERSAKGAIMAGLNMGIIKALPIPVPPLDLQRRFAAIVASVEQQKADQRAHLDELDTLFASLQSRAFRGVL